MMSTVEHWARYLSLELVELLDQWGGITAKRSQAEWTVKEASEIPSWPAFVETNDQTISNAFLPIDQSTFNQMKEHALS